MGSFCGSGSLFGKQQNTASSNSSSTSGQSASQLLPQLQSAASQISNQFSPTNIAALGPNVWQTGAADAQSGVAGNLQPAYGAAGQVAQGGIGDVSRYMSPYISNVVDATRADFAAQNARDLAGVAGQAAKLGALTGTGRTAAIQQAQDAQRRTQDPIIASLYNQGFQQSGQLAQADTNARIAGAGTIGSLTGVNTGANTALGSLGQNIYGTALTPYDLASKYGATIATLGNAAGQTFSNQTSGSTNQQTTTNPGIGSSVLGLLGMGMFGFSKGGAVEGEGVVDRYHKTIASLHAMNAGGSIPALYKGGNPGTAAQFQDPNDNDPGEAPLTNIAPQPQIGFGYMVPSASRMDLGAPQVARESGGSWLPGFDKGVFAGEAPTRMQRIGAMLMNVGTDNPFAGVAKSAFDQFNTEDRLRHEKYVLAKRLDHEAAVALGQVNGRPTIAAQQLAESQRQHDKPTWGVIGQNEFGQPTYGWINPNLAPNFSSRSPGAASVMPGETQGSVIPSNAAPGFKGGDMSKTGDEFLASLDDQTARLVKGIAEGRVQPPGSFALSKPYWQHMTLMVSQYDPTFDGTSWSARSKTANDFSAGKSAQNITSFNTAIGHLDSLDKAISGLDNSRFPWWNSLSQSARVQGGDAKYAEKLKAFQTAKTAVTDELVRAFRGSGGNVHDIIQWEKNINAADSPEALRGSVRSAIELLRSRIEAMGDTYNRGMGTNKDPMAWLSPKSRHALERIEMEGRASDAPEQKGVTQGYAAGQGSPKAVTDRLGQPGQSANNPVEVESAEQARTLGSGTWVRRRADGKILQVP